jgi:catechol 2,3-dioxygenase-like lactoylglutathione lyase family enzyme
MVLNHVDLQVPDVRAAAALFVRLFQFEQVSNAASPAIAILRGEGGVTLVLQRRVDERPWPEGFHVGFIVDDVQRVHDFHARASVEPEVQCSDVQVNGRGTMVYCRFSGLLVEVSVRRAH